mgnify:CR=1 FL=1
MKSVGTSDSRNRHRRRQALRASGFTLIELMLVLVIGVLGLLFDALFKALHRVAFRYLEPR